MIPALVLTAGLATRLRPLSLVRAKAAVPVAGQPLVRRILAQLRAAGVSEAVLNLHLLPHTIAGVVGDGSDLGMRVRYSWERPILGSAGGPRLALPLLDESTFLITNGDTLTDAGIPASRRQQIIEDLLGGRALPTTTALVSMVVGAGRARELPAIIRRLVEMSAAEANKEVAEVRSAVALTDDQRQRLAKALGEATGKQVEVKVVVDPSVLGGIVAQVGDTVIDGSVRSRLDKLKNAF